VVVVTNQWIYYEVRYPEGDLSHAYRWDGEANAEYLNSKGWNPAPYFFDRLYSGDNKMVQLKGTPDWAYDSQGNLIP
jgi:hypothetical protein